MILRFQDQIYNTKRPVGGLDDYGVTLGRDAGITGISRRYVVDLQFLMEDKDWLFEIWSSYGINSIISFELDGHDFILDLLNAAIENDIFSVPAKQGGIFAKIDNMFSEKIDIIGQRSELTNFTGNRVDTTVKWRLPDLQFWLIDQIVSEFELNESEDHVKKIGQFQNAQQFAGGNDSLTRDNCIALEQRKIKRVVISPKIQKIEFTPVLLQPRKPVQVFVKLSILFKMWDDDKSIELWDVNRVGFSFLRNVELYYDVTHENGNFGQVNQLGTIDTVPFLTSKIFATLKTQVQDIELTMPFLSKDQLAYIQVKPTILLQVEDQTGEKKWINMFINTSWPRMKIESEFNVHATLVDYELNQSRKIRSLPLPNVVREVVQKFNVDNYHFDLGELQNYYHIKLFNGLMVKNIGAMKVSLEDLLEFVYTCTGLRFVVDSKNRVITFWRYSQFFSSNQNEPVTKAGKPKITPAPWNYTHLDIGYENMEAIFGTMEYNTTNIFKSENDNLPEKRLSIYTKFRVGAFDVDSFIFDHFSDDKQSDHNQDDIFVFSTKERKIGTNGVKLGINWEFTPKRLINLHSFELSNYFRTLDFIETKRSASIEFDELSEISTVNFPEPFLKPFVYEFDGILRDRNINVNGSFLVNFGSETITCYLAEGEDVFSITQQNVSTFRTFVKNQ